MGLWKVIRTLARYLGDGVPSSPSPAIGQFCSDAEAIRAKEQIDRLVDEFVARNAGRARTNLDAGRGITLGDAPISGRFPLRRAGRGWRYERDRLCGLLVTETGDWSFQGFYVFRHGAQLDQRELSGWHWSRNGGWPQIPPYELAHVAEATTGSPVAALPYFRQAIAQWEGGETKRRP